MVVDGETLRAQLANTLASSDLPGLGVADSSGSRDTYDLGDYALLVTTDRLDDPATSGTVPFKGEVVARTATWWLDVTGDLAPNPVERIVDAQALLVRRVEPLGCRLGAWARLSGGLWHAYRAGATDLASGYERNTLLECPLVSAVDETGALCSAPAGQPRFVEARDLATRLFERGRQLAEERGVELVDTVYTFGELPSGELCTVNLLHAPDVSTFWCDGESQHEADIVAAWRERTDGAIKLEGELPSVLRVDVARAYLQLGECFIAEFTPTTGRAINRLSFALSAAGILA